MVVTKIVDLILLLEQLHNFGRILDNFFIHLVLSESILEDLLSKLQTDVSYLFLFFPDHNKTSGSGAQKVEKVNGTKSTPTFDL